MDVLRRADDAPRPTEWVRYSIENALESRRTIMILWLAVLVVVLTAVVSGIIAALEVPADGRALGFWEAFWSSFMRALDPGTMARDVGWKLRLASLVVTLSGILFLSAIIGLVTNIITDRTTRLRRSPSSVIARNHTVILGWSPKIIPLIQQLFVAARPRRSGSVVLLASVPRDEMERQVGARLPELARHEGKALVLRTGTTYDRSHLKIVRPDVAKAIVVLNPGGADGDAEVVRATLALLGTEPSPRPRLVAEIHSKFTAEALKTAPSVSGRVVVVRAADFVARLMAQVCLEPGLSQVYEDVLQFDGREIYIADPTAVKGGTFGEALLSYENAAPLGIKRDGVIHLCPPMDEQIAEGDQIVAIAEELRDVVAGPRREATACSEASPPRGQDPHKVLMIGWNDLAPEIIRQLDRCAPAGSAVTVRVDGDVVPEASICLPQGLETLSAKLQVEALDPEQLKKLMAERLRITSSSSATRAR